MDSSSIIAAMSSVASSIDLVEFVRRAKSIEEMQKRNPCLKRAA